MVLAELAPKQTEVVKALGAALGDANQMLTRYILDAYDSINHKSVVPFVLPLLEQDDVEIKLRAASLIGRFGGEMVGELQRQFAHASPQQKRVLVEILARIHNRDALQMILETFYDPDAELAREACDAVRRNIGQATTAQRTRMHRQVTQFMASSRARKDERVLTNCVLLIGFIGAANARQVLLKYSSPRNPLSLRRNALIGLKGVPCRGAAITAVANVAFRYLDEPDWLNIAQHALDLVEHLPLPKTYDRRWRELLKNRHPSVRQFAARRIAAQDSPATNGLLMQLLDHDDHQISEIALGALSRHRGATKLLLAALGRERKSEPAWRLAKILRHHLDRIDRASRKRIAGLARRDVEAGKPRGDALMYFLRNTEPALADQVMRDVGLKFRKARKWRRAIDCLRPLAGSDQFNDETRYELSLCELKQSGRDLAPHLRSEDPALAGFVHLAGINKFKLLDRLKKERLLEPQDLYYLGFHFAESNDAAGRKLGKGLLEHLVKKSPRTRHGKAAREKLKLAGLVK